MVTDSRDKAGELRPISQKDIEGSLPKGWVRVSLDSLTTDAIQRVPLPDERVKYIDISSIDRVLKTIERPQELIGASLPSRGRKQVAEGDTLVAMTRPNLNAVALVPAELHGQMASTGFDVLRPVQGIDPRWLAYLVRTEAFVKTMSGEVQGALYPAVRARNIRSYTVPVAPEREQKRILDELDRVLFLANACTKRLASIPVLIRHFRQAVLNAATSGALTHDWRINGNKETDAERAGQDLRCPDLIELPKGWRWRHFGDFVLNLRSGTSGVPTDMVTEFPVLRSSSVRPMRLDTSDVRYLPDSSRLRSADLLEDGDLLFTRLSGSLEYVANCVMVRGLGSTKVFYPDRLFRAKLIDPELGSYFQICFGGPALREHLAVETKSSVGHQRISKGGITGFPIPLPPRDERIEIVKRVASLLSLADDVEAQCASVRKFSERLNPLILAKAFRGELVRQDCKDESASVLMMKVALNRAEILARAKKNGKVRARSRVRAPKENAAMTKSRYDVDVKEKPYLAEQLRGMVQPATAEALFKTAELPLPEFYKQLIWEVAQGFINDCGETLEPSDAT